MMQYNSNVSRVVGSVADRLKQLQENPDAMLRTVALAVLPEVKKRVHVDGRDSSGGEIGTYTPGYMKLRTGNYGDAAKVSRGPHKGDVKDAGNFTRGKQKGQPRPKYNRTADTKVILSLTRQMENDLSVLPSGNGYGIGYNNPVNFQKSQWNEETYKKPIWNLTADEKQLAKNVAVRYAEDFLKQQ